MQKSLAEICTNPGEHFKNSCDLQKIRWMFFVLCLFIVNIITTSTNIAIATTIIIVAIIIRITIISFLAGK